MLNRENRRYCIDELCLIEKMDVVERSLRVSSHFSWLHLRDFIYTCKSDVAFSDSEKWDSLIPPEHESPLAS